MIPPIVLAPLAGGPSTPELAAAVSNAGGLGFLGAGYLTAEELARRIARTRELTDEAIGVNLFVLTDTPVDDEALARYARELEPEARGAYAGAAGYVGYGGNLDTAIALRTIVAKDGAAYAQAAAGIVADSTPHEESLEIDNKVAAMLHAIEEVNSR